MSSSSAAGRPGVETAGALAELYRHDFARTTRACRQEPARLVLVEARPGAAHHVHAGAPAYTKKALEKRGVEVLAGEVVESIDADARHPEVGRSPQAHTLVWGAGLQANPLVALARASSCSTAAASPVGPDLSLAGPSRGLRGRRHRLDHRHEDEEVCRSSARSRCRAGERAGENIARRLAGKETGPFAYHDKGTMATIGRGAAVVQMPGGRTMKGRPPCSPGAPSTSPCCPPPRTARRPSSDWTWAGLTHKRSGRITPADEDEAMRERDPVGPCRAEGNPGEHPRSIPCPASRPARRRGDGPRRPPTCSSSSASPATSPA